ncbi:hypothetical protein V8E52_009555 [Russula decolorans]
MMKNGIESVPQPDSSAVCTVLPGLCESARILSLAIVAERRSFHLFMRRVAAATQGTYLRNFNRHTYLTTYIRVRKTSGCKILSPKRLDAHVYISYYRRNFVCGTGGFGLQRQERGFTTLCRASRTRLVRAQDFWSPLGLYLQDHMGKHGSHPNLKSPQVFARGFLLFHPRSTSILDSHDRQENFSHSWPTEAHSRFFATSEQAL